MNLEEKKEMMLSEFISEAYDTGDDNSEDVIDTLFQLQEHCQLKGINFDRCMRAANCFFDLENSKETIVSVYVNDNERTKLMYERMIGIFDNGTVKSSDKTGE